MKKTINEHVYDVSIIGAGMGGLASANLLQRGNEKVIIFESHYYPGGCAGYFKRREGYFDVGATTLSGIKENRPLGKLIKDLKIDLQIHQEDIGIRSYYKDKEFNYHACPDKLIKEIKDKFNYDATHFIYKIISIEKKLWKALDSFPNFPLPSLGDLVSLLKLAPSLIASSDIFYKNFYEYLPKDLKENKEFITYIDQMLLISTQLKSKDCPAFIGIIGFLYPSDTYSSENGMYGVCQKLADNLKENGGILKLKEEVLNIKKTDHYYGVTTNKGHYKTKRIIFNTPPSVTQSILSTSDKDYYKKKNQDKGHIWGAMTAYFSFKLLSALDTRYHQVILDEKDREIFKTSSLFYSFSHENDDGVTRVTVSTHIEKDGFSSKDQDYYKLKEDFKKLVIACFDKYITVEITDFKFDSVSTPLTWHHYTKRPLGEVGGLRHRNALSLLRLIPNKTNQEIFNVGDYSFPGQGIVSVVQGAYNIKTIL